MLYTIINLSVRLVIYKENIDSYAALKKASPISGYLVDRRRRFMLSLFLQNIVFLLIFCWFMIMCVGVWHFYEIFLTISDIWIGLCHIES